MDKDTKQILKNYEESFVEEYSTWKVLLDEFNISLFKTADIVDNENILPYTYDEFCSAFIEQAKKWLVENTKINHESLNYIFNLMLYDKILEKFNDNNIVE
jgi:hypothetical protein